MNEHSTLLTKANEKKTVEEQTVLLSTFLETVPPGKLVRLHKANVSMQLSKGTISVPQIRLHCSSDDCGGERFFKSNNYSVVFTSTPMVKDVFFDYSCSNCGKVYKTFALCFRREEDKFYVMKYGEVPPFGPPTPSSLVNLIGPDRDIFLKGRRCENQGLGIGAFSYYRRVVENQKDRIFDKIITVSKRLGAPDDKIEILENCKEETQFSKALKNAKPALPESLLINGHNPLLLLHSALSDGLHDRSDKHCLEIATDVRVVLRELSERLAQALKDENEIEDAVKRLARIKNK
ncbi:MULTISPECIES: hypothetical protein [unclassified Maridesulfovibrio]|uniref:hypothetical protein n=1 Tax=unclassified Maridesulfovibrio TaxID=2794999 RepID=UPI003B4002AC